MKTSFIEPHRHQSPAPVEIRLDDQFFKLLSEYKILESHIVYFSAGESKIKEILVHRDPTYSV